MFYNVLATPHHVGQLAQLFDAPFQLNTRPLSLTDAILLQSHIAAYVERHGFDYMLEIKPADEKPSTEFVLPCLIGEV